MDSNLLGVTEERVLLLADLDGASTVLRDQHTIPFRHAHGYPFAIFVERTGTHGEDFCFIEFLDGGFREEDAAGGLRLGFDALDEDAVEEGDQGSDGAHGLQRDDVSM